MDITSELVTKLVVDKDKTADTLKDSSTDGDGDEDTVGTVEVDILKCKDDERIDELVAGADTEESAESVAVDDKIGVALNVTLEVTDNIADCDIVGEFEVVALVLIEFVTMFVREKVDFGLSNGTLEDVILLVGETLDVILDES
jgi:hypothetical protein